MRAYPRIAARAVLLLLLAGPAFPQAEEEPGEEPPKETSPEPPKEAQEEAEAPAQSDSKGEVYLEAEVWVAQPTGTEYAPATQLDPDNPLQETILTISHGTEPEGRFRAGYTLPGDWGTIVVTYLKQEDDAELARATPGEFMFGEVSVNPLFAGFANDGLTDSFTTVTRTRLRDLRLDIYRPAFRGARVSGDWFVGWRRVTHIRQMSTLYRALLPDLPVFLPPTVPCPPNAGCPNLAPIPDSGSIDSSFEGRGISAGLEVDFHLWQDKLWLETGVSLAVLRGEIKSDYNSTTSAYFVRVDIDGDGTPESLIVNPLFYEDFDEFASDVGQATLPIGLEADAIATTSQVVDASVALRWRARRWLEAFVGFRDTRYTDVGVDLRAKVVAISIDDFGFPVRNFEDVTEVDRSVTYEGFYGGIAFRLK